MAEEGGRTDRSARSRLTLALALLFAIGAAGVFVAGALHAGPVLWADACGYLSGAQVLAESHTYGIDLVQLNPDSLASPPRITRVPWWPPGYPVAVALVSGMSASEPLRMVIAAHWLGIAGQILAAAGFGVLTWLATGRRTAAPLVAGLYLLSAPLLYEAPRLLSEHLFMPLVAWAAVMHLKAIQTRKRGFIAGAVLLWSAAVLTRYTGAIIAGVAGLTSLAVIWSCEDRWHRLREAVVPVLVSWTVVAIWLGRNILLAGRTTQHYAPGETSIAMQIKEAVLAWLLGTCGVPLVPSVAPDARSMTMFFGGLFIAVSILVIIISMLTGHSEEQPLEWRWFRTFCLVGIPVLFASLVFAATKGRLNTLFGRLMMPTSTLTIILLVGSAFRLPSARFPVLVACLCLAAGGLLQGATNLMLPDGRRQLDGVVALAENPDVQAACRGRRLLLLPSEGIGPTPQMLHAGIFVPAAETVYWIDNPLYSGVQIEDDDVERLVSNETVDALLRGPSRQQPQFSPNGPGPDWLRHRVYMQYIAGQRRELRHLPLSGGTLSLKTDVAAREGPWTVQEVRSPSRMQRSD